MNFWKITSNSKFHSQISTNYYNSTYLMYLMLFLANINAFFKYYKTDCLKNTSSFFAMDVTLAEKPSKEIFINLFE